MSQRQGIFDKRINDSPILLSYRFLFYEEFMIVFFTELLLTGSSVMTLTKDLRPPTNGGTVSQLTTLPQEGDATAQARDKHETTLPLEEQRIAIPQDGHLTARIVTNLPLDVPLIAPPPHEQVTAPPQDEHVIALEKHTTAPSGHVKMIGEMLMIVEWIVNRDVMFG